jgi:hypothetical protein
MHPKAKTHQDMKTHNRCVLDEHHVSSVTCNGHGTPKSRRVNSLDDVVCECDRGFSGKFCDYCTDPTNAFPDCTNEISASIYDPEEVHNFLSRRKYDENGYSTVASRYFQKGELEPIIFNEECGWVDFPDDLNKIEFSKEFADGSFHIADFYVMNHKQDNIVKFTPRHTGTFKLLVQQPEVETALKGEDSSAFDIEIGLYDPENSKFVKSTMNRHIQINQDLSVKMEHASLNYEFQELDLGRPFYFFFRAVNITHETEAEGCTTLFMEAEFFPAKPHCLHDPEL